MARNLKVTLLADRPELHKFDLVLARICEKRWLEQSNLLTGYIIVDYLSPVNEHNQSEKSGQWSGGPQGGQPRPPCMAAAAALCPLGSRGRPRRQRALIKQRRVDWRHRRCSWQRTAGPTRIGRLPGGFPGTLIDLVRPAILVAVWVGRGRGRVDWRHRRYSWQRTAGPTRIGRLSGGFLGTPIDLVRPAILVAVWAGRGRGRYNGERRRRRRGERRRVGGCRGERRRVGGCRGERRRVRWYRPRRRRRRSKRRSCRWWARAS